MPPRRGRGRTTRHTAEESRAGSDDDVHQVENVTRQIGEMELVLARFQRTNPPTFSAVEESPKVSTSRETVQEEGEFEFLWFGEFWFWQWFRQHVTDLCCSDFVVESVCGNYSSEAGELLHCIRMIISLSIVVSVLCCCSVFLLGCEGERQYRTLISLLVWCKDERVIPVCLYTHQWPLTILHRTCCQLLNSLPPFLGGFPGFAAGRGYDPAGGASGGG
ncbi:hypothetical protein F511_08391 [Dorcoceras hygrometricum]|uniref:Uncharacterized protein n=1 Tax=Dorcoceras hygrometricum TaxID=472368 RepID=A0A2Z7B7F7_9LAMI|nr:hypothetical protein F511_08391 [Dorcoceras hygrometricum]